MERKSRNILTIFSIVATLFVVCLWCQKISGISSIMKNINIQLEIMDKKVSVPRVVEKIINVPEVVEKIQGVFTNVWVNKRVNKRVTQMSINTPCSGKNENTGTTCIRWSGLYINHLFGWCTNVHVHRKTLENSCTMYMYNHIQWFQLMYICFRHFLAMYMTKRRFSVELKWQKLISIWVFGTKKTVFGCIKIFRLNNLNSGFDFQQFY